MSLPAVEEKLVQRMAEFHYDPEGFIDYAYPWGKGTLAGIKGMRIWQRDLVRAVAKKLKACIGKANQIVRVAICSGHGIGKSAVMGMLMDWAMSTSVDCHIILTAGTKPQLDTKIWPEVNKWHSMCITGHWFDLTATSMRAVDEKHALNWRADIAAWNKNRPEAFAGLHNQGKRLMVIMDEASQIDEKIWETVMGAMTDEFTEIFFFVFGNGTRNKGSFKDCFGVHRHLYIARNIDSRTVEGTNKPYLDQLVDSYGEDSDLVRVRVKGQFPRAGDLQFIPSDWYNKAKTRRGDWSDSDPIVAGLDMARSGKDFVVCRIRRGMNMRKYRTFKLSGYDARDSYQTALKVSQFLHDETKDEGGIDCLFVDAVGLGGPVADHLRHMNVPAIDVVASETDVPDRTYGNVRAYMWGKYKEAIRVGLAVPEKDDDLETDTTEIQYYYNAREQLMLEKVEDMEERGLHSPDDGTAAALTFAAPVLPRAFEDDRVEQEVAKKKWHPLNRLNQKAPVDKRRRR